MPAHPLSLSIASVIAAWYGDFLAKGLGRAGSDIIYSRGRKGFISPKPEVKLAEVTPPPLPPPPPSQSPPLLLLLLIYFLSSSPPLPPPLGLLRHG